MKWPKWWPCVSRKRHESKIEALENRIRRINCDLLCTRDDLEEAKAHIANMSWMRFAGECPLDPGPMLGTDPDLIEGVRIRIPEMCTTVAISAHSLAEEPQEVLWVMVHDFRYRWDLWGDQAASKVEAALRECVPQFRDDDKEKEHGDVQG